MNEKLVYLASLHSAKPEQGILENMEKAANSAYYLYSGRFVELPDFLRGDT